ncbi:MAG: hypothetical protein MN733_28195 [Nitrososphaera sp.]|nr:hypothetical protein [Nitrososphaera sp.]
MLDSSLTLKCERIRKAIESCTLELPKMTHLYKANFQVIISRKVNQGLDAVAAQRGILKWEAIAEAIEEYVARHEGEVK